MSINELLANTHLRITPLARHLCEEGVGIMGKSIDPLHNQNHILRMLDDLDRFVKNSQDIKNHLFNHDILLLSICWHDVWRVNRFHKNKYLLLYHTWVEGWGSMRIFKKRAKEAGMDKKIIDQVAYAIRKHSEIQIFPLKTVESKLLHDLDTLEMWSLERLHLMKQVYLDQEKINPSLLRLAKFFFDHFMVNAKESQFHFEWSKKEFLKRKAEYIKEVGHLMETYGNLLTQRQPVSIKPE